MNQGLEYIPIGDKAREEWLALRRKSIGGSDAAGIMGLNPYSSPYSVWADKTGRLPEKPDNEAMRQGRDFEEYVAKRWCEESEKKVRRVNSIIRNPEYPFAHANIDRMVIGEDAGLECKTTSVLNLKKFKDGNYPESYYVQCMHYMAVTGAQRWYLAVLVLNQGFHSYTIERDESEIIALMDDEREFWQNVEADTPPPMDGSDATTDALQIIYAESGDGSADLFGREGIIDEYYRQKALMDEASERMESLKQILMSDLADNEMGFCDKYKVTWKTQSRKTFDTKRFTADNPDTDLSDYYKTSVFRKFEIKEI